MARINIEDSLFKDERFAELMLALGSRTLALGSIVESFILAQKHFSTTVNDRLIPFNEWQRIKHGDQLVVCGLAEVRDAGVYVKGSKENFAWIIQRSEAGKNSARIKQQRKSTTVASRSTEEHGSQPLPLPLPLSPSLPLSHSLSQTHSQKLLKTKNIKKPTADKSGGSVIFDTYRLAYFNRWKVEPIRNARMNALCKQLHERLGADACEVVKFYLTHNDAWFLKNQHDLGSLVAKAESLHTQWQRGQPVTSQQVRTFEKQAGNLELLEKINKGEI